MKHRILLIAIVLLLPATWALAQGAPEFPAGKWWERPAIVEKLALTTEQRTKLDEIFRANADQLIDLRADVEKKTLALRTEMERPKIDRAAVQKSAAKLNDARGAMFERELMMFVDMRGVLSDSQWMTLRDAMANQREKMRDRKFQGGPGGGQGQRPPRP